MTDRSAYRQKLLEDMQGEQPAPKAAVPAAPAFDAGAYVDAVMRKRAQRAAMEAQNLARVTGSTEAKRAAAEVKRAAFDPAGMPGGKTAAAGKDRVWVPAHTRDGVSVEGYWRKNKAGEIRALPDAPNPIAAYHGQGVGVFGKTLGALGLDDSGARAQTTWGAAMRNTVYGQSLINQVAEIGHAITRARAGEGDPGTILTLGGSQVGGAAFGSVPKGALRSGLGRTESIKAAEGVATDLNALGLYSQAQRAAAALPQEKGTGAQYKAMLERAGVKKDEMQWTQLGKLLDERADKPITKAEIVKHLDQNAVKVSERRYGGGEDRHPDVVGQAEFADYAFSKEGFLSLDPEDVAAGMQAYRERLLKWDREGGNRTKLPLSHWTDERGTIVHTRTNELEVLDAQSSGLQKGDKVHHVDEIQSDWGQAYRKSDPEAKRAKADAALAKMNKAEAAFRAELDTARKLLAEHGVDTAQDGSYGTVKAQLAALERKLDAENEKRPVSMQESDPPDSLWDVAMMRDELKSRFEDAQLARREQDLAQTDLLRATPEGPFVTNTAKWVDLALKTNLIEAARNPNVKAMTIIRGADAAMRFEHFSDFADVGTGKVEPVWTKSGKGLIKFYDELVTERLKDIVRKIDKDAKITRAALDAEDEHNVHPVVTVVELTPKMRERLVKEGLPLFAGSPITAASAPGLSAEDRRRQHLRDMTGRLRGVRRFGT